MRITSLKATSTLLLLLLIKSNLFRLKGGLFTGFFVITMISGLIFTTSVAGSAAYYIFRCKKSNDDELSNGDDRIINTEAVIT